MVKKTSVIKYRVVCGIILSIIHPGGGCASAADRMPVIGIIQYVEHQALDAAIAAGWQCVELGRRAPSPAFN